MAPPRPLATMNMPFLIISAVNISLTGIIVDASAEASISGHTQSAASHTCVSSGSVDVRSSANISTGLKVYFFASTTAPAMLQPHPSLLSPRTTLLLKPDGRRKHAIKYLPLRPEYLVLCPFQTSTLRDFTCSCSGKFLRSLHVVLF